MEPYSLFMKVNLTRWFFFPGITASWLLLYTSVLFSNLITVKNNQLVMILFKAETKCSQTPATEQLHMLIRHSSAGFPIESIFCRFRLVDYVEKLDYALDTQESERSAFIRSSWVKSNPLWILPGTFNPSHSISSHNIYHRVVQLL